MAKESLQELKLYFPIIMSVADEQMSTSFAMNHADDLLFTRAKELVQQLKETP